MTKPLFDIAQEYRQIADDLMASGGELTDELEARLAINEQELHQKADAYAAIIAEYDGQNEAIDREIERLKRLKTTNNNQVARLRGRLADAVRSYGKFSTGTRKFWTQERLSVSVQNELQVPDKFMRPAKPTLPTVDKAAILAAFKESGELPPGVTIDTSISVVIR